ncbi:peptidylprolyl isomerase [Paenibacillus xanthanilyticus]|uniref:peptidylprolyl isomerase n=1 Tax=Paenibacillus xanthanilyticus TaxID=1783531 RepID=A0ABV8KB72_9BACL
MDRLQDAAVRVGGQVITYKDLLRQGLLSDTLQAVEQSIERVVIAAWAADAGIAATQEETGSALNDYRKRRGLFTAAKTSEWLQQHGLQLGDLTDYVRAGILRRKLAGTLIGEAEIAKFFHEHRASFDRAEISRLLVAEHGEAMELLFRVEEGEPFFKLARAFSQEESTRMAGGYAGEFGRDELGGELAAAVFGGQAGDVIGPLETKSGHMLVLIESLRPAELDEETNETIRELLFADLLARRMSEAEIRVSLWKGAEV